MLGLGAAAWVEAWMLKQVQHDDTPPCSTGASTGLEPPSASATAPFPIRSASAASPIATI